MLVTYWPFHSFDLNQIMIHCIPMVGWFPLKSGINKAQVSVLAFFNLVLDLFGLQAILM